MSIVKTSSIFFYTAPYWILGLWSESCDKKCFNYMPPRLLAIYELRWSICWEYFTENVCAIWTMLFTNLKYLRLGYSRCSDHNLGPVLILWLSFPGMGILVLKIRWSWDCLIFNMGIPIRVWWPLYIETAHCSSLCNVNNNLPCKFNAGSTELPSRAWISNYIIKCECNYLLTPYTRYWLK